MRPDGCASFIIIVNGITRITPLAADEHCSACSHPWFSHSLDHVDLGHPNTAYQRGGLLESDCGGFTSTHPFGLGPEPLARPLPVAHAPPIMAYQGVRAAEPGRTIDRRNASAERARTAQAQVRGGRSARNIPHMRVQTRARMDDEVLPAGSRTAEGSKVKFSVAFIPHTPPNIPGGRQGYPARQFQWPAAAFAKLADVLHQVGLVFAVTLSGSGSVWRELGEQVMEHCDQQTIEIATHPASTSTWAAPTDLPFLFLTTPPSRLNQFARTFHPYDDLDVNTFTCENLRKKPFGTITLPLAGALSDHPLLIIAPRFFNLRSHLARIALSHLPAWDIASTPSRFSVHKCFAARVMSTAEPAIVYACTDDGCAPAGAPIPELDDGAQPAAIARTSSQPALAASSGDALFLDSDSEYETRTFSEMMGLRDGSSHSATEPGALPSLAQSATEPPVIDSFPPIGSSATRTSLASEASVIRSSPATQAPAAQSGLSPQPIESPATGPSSAIESPATGPSSAIESPATGSSSAIESPMTHSSPIGSAPLESPATEVGSRTPVLASARSIHVRERSPSLEAQHSGMQPFRRAYRQPTAQEPELAPDPSTRPGRIVTIEEPIGQSDVASWAERTRRAVPHADANTPRPKIRAPDAETAGQVLVFLTRWLFGDPGPAFHGSGLSFGAALQNFVGEKVVSCNITSLNSLAAVANNLDIQIGEGIGPAIARTTLRSALKLATADHDLWEPRGQYSSILFHASRSVIPTRRARLQACGFLALLHMLVLHAGPDPVSPFLLRAAIEDRSRAMSADPSFLGVLDPDTYNTLAAWVDRDHTSPLHLDPLSPLGQLLMTANINPELHGIECALVSEMVLGDKDVSTHPDLLAFSEGLHHVLAPGSLLDIAFLGRSAAYLAFMYDRRLHDVKLLLEHLEFNSAVKVSEQAMLTIADDDEMSTTTWDLLYEDLFASRLSEYLQGFGHPNHPHIVELLDHTTITAAADDGLLRARAFLQLMSGSDLLPTNPDWKLKVCHSP
ncbi:hypothetical protein ACG7TL_007943 [Trametes sanguinea]